MNSEPATKIDFEELFRAVQHGTPLYDSGFPSPKQLRALTSPQRDQLQAALDTLTIPLPDNMRDNARAYFAAKRAEAEQDSPAAPAQN